MFGRIIPGDRSILRYLWVESTQVKLETSCSGRVILPLTKQVRVLCLSVRQVWPITIHGTIFIVLFDKASTNICKNQIQQYMLQRKKCIMLKAHFLLPWSTLIGDDLPYRARRKATQSMKVNMFCFSCEWTIS